MQALLGPDRASRDEEALVAGHHCIGVDDAEVDPGDDAAIRLCALDRNRDLGRHVEKSRPASATRVTERIDPEG
jgi:hypothetical protein